MGIDSLVLHACVVDRDVLGFHTVSHGKEGFLLFLAEKSEAAAARLTKDAIVLPSKVNEAKEVATAAVAGQEKASRGVSWLNGKNRPSLRLNAVL